MKGNDLLVWGRLAAACALTWYVYKDTLKRQIPWRNLWIIMTFLFFPSILVYLYYRYHIKKQGQISNLYKREIQMRQKLEEQRIRLKEEEAAWIARREEEMARNRITEEELESARRERAEAKARRMEELAEERRRQEEAAAELLHIKR